MRKKRLIDPAYCSDWMKKNPERAKLIQKRYRDNNKDKTSARWKIYKENNYGIIKACQHRRRARNKNAAGSFTGADVKRLFSLQRGGCGICKTLLGSSYHVDHIVPLARNGTNYPSNIQLLCKQCNLSKSWHDPIDYMQSIGMLL